ncbi:beta-lactamase-like protein [Scheffersomyces coipomensis]|uniref:beta-lactamase-like protein n=1 Tax=Scheffersomyces coipomensis TaxID=1788519 RepID=UPI00315CC412
MFTFSLITPPDGELSFRAGILSFDNEFKILADPSWNGKDPNAVLFIEQTLGDINAIILSHSTPEFISGYVLLCIKFPNLMATIPVYSTLPVNQLGRISTVEYYRANGILGPLKDALLEIQDVDELFDKVNVLKYLQSTTLFDGKIVLTAYNAGHTLGGTFWLITKRIDKIIYAPAWNHSKDSFLNSAAFLSASNGSPVSSLLRPTAFITGTDIGSTMSHKRRTDKFLELVDATLANGGAVVIPTSLSGRFLEVFHLIDEHLQGAPIPVYFLSYSGTKILSYASNLVDWMVPAISKDWDDGEKSQHSSNMPFDPSKVDLLIDPQELIQLVGPKIVFCSGIDLRNGDLSSEAFQYLCQDEKNTILLTEKSSFASDKTLNSSLYKEWYALTKNKLGGRVEDGVAVPLETVFSIDDWTKEEPMIGGDLTEFQEKINEHRKEKLLAKVRDKKNQNLLNSDLVDAEDSSDDEEDEVEAANSSDEEKDLDSEEKSLASASNGTVVGVKTIDELAAHEAFLTDYIKESLEDNKPIDLRITHRLKPRQAMFPYFPNSHKQKFDDYGEIIDIKDFQKSDEISNTKIIMEGKKKFEQNEKRDRGKNNDRNGNKQKKDKVNKLTPQEQLNNEIFQKYLDTLHGPKKRVKLGASASAYAAQVQQLRVRCVLSFIDLSGLVDLRSLGIIVSSLKPYNLLLIPDFTNNNPDDNESNGLQLAQSYFINQQTEQKLEENKKSLFSSSRYLSLASIRSGLSSVSSYGSNNKMQVSPALINQTAKIGGDADAGSIGLSNFEINLDDSIIEGLNWQSIGGSYKVAQVYGELEIHNQESEEVENKKRTVSDVINSSTQFTLKKVKQEDFIKQQLLLADKVEDTTLNSVSSNGPSLAIGNIRLPDLKKKLQGLNLNAEFKSEGTLVVNDSIAIRKVAYGSIDGDDTGDIIIDGNIGPLYYKKMQPYSRSGGTRKCFYEFQTLVACYTSADTTTKKECTPVFDDYFECLHGYKERERTRIMAQQLKDNEISGKGVVAKDLYKSAGAVYESLDLVKK